MPQRAATIESLPMAFSLVKEMQACCSASPFDPQESRRINVLPRRSASNLRA